MELFAWSQAELIILHLESNLNWDWLGLVPGRRMLREVVGAASKTWEMAGLDARAANM
jgi:hypothetical protein